MSSRRTALFRFDEKIAEEFLLARGRAPVLVGIDEAGRGPWAGPVVAAAAVLSPDFFDRRLNDCKQLSPEVRSELFSKLRSTASLCAVGVGDVELIDSQNILRATHSAMKAALDALLRQNPDLRPDLLLVDGLPTPDLGFPQRAIVDGDCKSASIAAASVVAKVTRDGMMEALHLQYPQYGFARHKGYGTRLHQEALWKHGPSPVHRKSFAPVRAACAAVNLEDLPATAEAHED